MNNSRWIEPEVTRAALTAWEQEGYPAEIWPLSLLDDNLQAVMFFTPAALIAATVNPPLEFMRYARVGNAFQIGN